VAAPFVDAVDIAAAAVAALTQFMRSWQLQAIRGRIARLTTMHQPWPMASRSLIVANMCAILGVPKMTSCDSTVEYASQG
jgi:hypothetical protein